MQLWASDDNGWASGNLNIFVDDVQVLSIQLSGDWSGGLWWFVPAAGATISFELAGATGDEEWVFRQADGTVLGQGWMYHQDGSGVAGNLRYDVTTNAACPAKSCPPRVRKEWRQLSAAERQEFVDAVKALDQAGVYHGESVYDGFVRTHYLTENEEYAHGTNAFLPWHRQYIWDYENALRNVADSCLTLPYWDWTLDAGDEINSELFSPSADQFGTVPRRASCVTDGAFSGWQANAMSEGSTQCLYRSRGRGGFSGPATVQSIVISETFYGGDASGADPDTGVPGTPCCSGFRRALEGTPHAAPHNFVGGVMASMASPSDPLFFLHHCNVDKIWAQWQDCHGFDKQDKSVLGTVDTYHMYEGTSDAPIDQAMPGMSTTPRDMHSIRQTGHGPNYQYAQDSSHYAYVASCPDSMDWFVAPGVTPQSSRSHHVEHQLKSFRSRDPLGAIPIGGLRGQLRERFEEELAATGDSSRALAAELALECQLLPRNNGLDMIPMEWIVANHLERDFPHGLESRCSTTSRDIIPPPLNSECTWELRDTCQLFVDDACAVLPEVHCSCGEDALCPQPRPAVGLPDNPSACTCPDDGNGNGNGTQANRVAWGAGVVFLGFLGGSLMYRRKKLMHHRSLSQISRATTAELEVDVAGEVEMETDCVAPAVRQDQV